MKLAIINGPNLNLLGQRETAVYGSKTFDNFLADLRAHYTNVDLHYFQSNVEGEIINLLHNCNTDFKGIILNAGGYTHTSVAIADAVGGISIPVIEVHISNIFQRENFRHVSYLGAKCIGSISGFGLDSYKLAIEQFIQSQVS